jgi:hypothetical protein
VQKEQSCGSILEGTFKLGQLRLFVGLVAFSAIFSPCPGVSVCPVPVCGGELGPKQPLSKINEINDSNSILLINSPTD